MMLLRYCLNYSFALPFPFSFSSFSFLHHRLRQRRRLRSVFPPPEEQLSHSPIRSPFSSLQLFSLRPLSRQILQLSGHYYQPELHRIVPQDR
ncbi:hypothetical protein HanRHA438_Chr11g0503341 [Helianthus annuus]|nr:hypothetical protein HanIR_Chr11g0528151 [Helianthus annuus]KAJ0870698.1 hypothetical protein HanRHA438_Chr11g0503341 [Helianthus annuus]